MEPSPSVVTLTTPSPAADPGMLRISLPDQIKDLLLGQIVDGSYPPGHRLVETAIARQIGVSQGPVREALRQLAGMGLIQFEANRGCRVRQVDQTEIDEVSEVRAALEETAARLAAGSRPDLVPLTAEVDGMAAAAATEDRQAYVRHAMRFHRLIVVASGNRVLLSTWDSLAIEGRTAQLVLVPGFDMVGGAEEHRQILDAVAAADPAAAAQLSREHEEAFIRKDPGGTASPG
ncbi:GntR family transcriptional regulator [Mycolicibacterium gilvum]|nr:GntR family transcriptional regulator [Mycolicibacterium gilvum]MCV7056595.1 GntR family transcriptional regulator [Mycolicibacterium gilvum]